MTLVGKTPVLRKGFLVCGKSQCCSAYCSPLATRFAMERDYKNEFILRADNGQFRLKIIEVFGFPDTTSHWGGYDTVSVVEIVSSNYSVKGELYISTGQLLTFYEQLRTCYETLKGTAKLSSSEENLNMDVVFDGLGHVTVKGSYKERHHEDNELLFELAGDQTYIFQGLAGLSDIALVYGTNPGLK